MSHSMNRAEREEFLAGLHVGVLSVDGGDGTPPLTVPVWYTYQPGGEPAPHLRIPQLGEQAPR